MAASFLAITDQVAGLSALTTTEDHAKFADGDVRRGIEDEPAISDFKPTHLPGLVAFSAFFLEIIELYSLEYIMKLLALRSCMNVR